MSNVTPEAIPYEATIAKLEELNGELRNALERLYLHASALHTIIAVHSPELSSPRTDALHSAADVLGKAERRTTSAKS